MIQVRKALWFMMALGAVLLVAAWANGAPLPAPASQPVVVVAAPSHAVSDLLDWLLKLAGLAATTAVTLLLQRWLGGKVSADKLAVYSRLAVDAVDHAEELGHQAIKAGAPQLDGNAKADAALAYVVKTADALKLRPMAETAVKGMIEAKVGAGREWGTPSPQPATPPPLPPLEKE